MTDTEKQERIEKAVAYFKEGYNCSQSVVSAFADVFGFTREQALMFSASFGAGIGKMRQTCGAACGMFMLAGLLSGSADPKDREGKAANFRMVQEMAAKFKEQNGSLVCGELLGLRPIGTSEGRIPAPGEAPAPVKKRPCPEMVRTAATIFSEYL